MSLSGDFFLNAGGDHLSRPQQYLYFFPEPQGQGSFLPTLVFTLSLDLEPFFFGACGFSVLFPTPTGAASGGGVAFTESFGAVSYTHLTLPTTERV